MGKRDQVPYMSFSEFTHARKFYSKTDNEDSLNEIDEDDYAHQSFRTYLEASINIEDFNNG